MTDDRPEAVAVYVHWPYCARICPYCDFNVVRARGRTEEAAALSQAILADLRAQAALLGPRSLASIFFGGGTPSLMPPQAVEAVVDAAADLFALDGPVEITLEANPTDAEAARFADLARAGVNRLSLGVQALDDEALRFLGRNHSAAEARHAADLALEAVDRLSIDLIYARPGQTPHAWADELSAVLAWGPEHVSPYQLTIEPGTAFGRAVARGAWIPPDADRAADLFDLTQTVLGSAGFEAYEVSNHARTASARSSHNLHVWRGGDYLGLGPGAHGRLTLDGARTATVAHRRVADYVERVRGGAPWVEREVLTPRQAAEERLILALRTAEGAPRALLADLGVAADREPLADLVRAGFMALSTTRVAATATGRPVLDALIKALLV